MLEARGQPVFGRCWGDTAPREKPIMTTPPTRKQSTPGGNNRSQVEASAWTVVASFIAKVDPAVAASAPNSRAIAPTAVASGPGKS